MTAYRIALSICCLIVLTLSVAGCSSETENGAADIQSNQSDENLTAVLPAAPVMTGDTHAKGVEDALNRRRAENDSWRTEVLNDGIVKNLKLIEDYYSTGHITTDFVPISQDFVCQGINQESLAVVFQDNQLTVERNQTKRQAVDSENAEATHGAQGLKDCLNAFWSLSDQPKVKFKVVRVELDAENSGAVNSEILYQASAQMGDRLREQNAVWICTWSASDSNKLTLESIEIYDFEQITYGSTLPMFEEITSSVLEGEEAYEQQLSQGVSYWQKRIQATLGQELFGHNGFAVGDVNGDLIDDLYICTSGGLPNRLLIRQSDGTAVDEAAKYGLDFLDSTPSALFSDLNNDGKQELALLTSHNLYVLQQGPTGKFETAAQLPIESKNALSLSIADIDDDNLLDIYVCGYAYPTGKAEVPRPYHDANNGFPNTMFRNLGDWKFEDATQALGLNQNNRRYSFAAAFDDYDNDGDLDLYVANDYGRNNLYQNNGGKFTDVAAEAGVEDISAGMAVSWGDINRDGHVDLYVSNMFSSAGNRVTYQRNFREQADSAIRGMYQRHARGNSLFVNSGDGTFVDQSVDAGVTMGRWAWGSRLIDINHDGFLDVVVANGNITGDDPDDL